MTERYRPTFGHVVGVEEPAMTPDPTGGWISYADHLALLERAEELLAKWEGSSKRNDDVLVFEALDLLRSLLNAVATQEGNNV